MSHANKEGLNSHIQMPEFLLKNFVNERGSFYYFDVLTKYIGTKGHPHSTNTERGYFSTEFETTLNKTIETPFSNVVDMLNSHLIAGQEYLPKSITPEVIYNFLYALISRSPMIFQKVKENSHLLKYCSNQDQHKRVVCAGIEFAQECQLLSSSFKIGILQNQTDVPFVLPIEGMYLYKNDDEPIINLPISPKNALVLISNSFVQKIGCRDDELALLQVSNTKIIEFMNGEAFSTQMEQKYGHIICPEKRELERLAHKYA